MNKTFMTIENRSCTVYSDKAPEFILIQPADKREIDLLDKQTAHIKTLTSRPFAFAAFEVTDWNNELSPWQADAVFGDEPFGNGGQNTLAFIEKFFIPRLKNKFGKDLPIILGGYSLAGLFSLWAAYNSNKFNAAAAVSPSVWFDGWLEYIEENSPFAKVFYLSLGKKEEKTRNKTMAAVGENIRRQYEKLCENNAESVLEFNEGNHFTQPQIRTAKGFAWCINALHKANQRKEIF